MTDLTTISRLGVDNLSTDGSFDQDNALFKEKFSGEVLKAFDEVNIFKPLHMTRTIDNGKAATFPVMGTLNAKYHQTGENTATRAEQAGLAERKIVIDDLLYANFQVSDLDDAKNHFDVWSEWAKQAGLALSNQYDANVARVLVKAARSSSPLTGQPGGTVIQKGATLETDGTVLAAALFDAAQVFDENNIPDMDRFAVFRPAQYYLMVQAKDTINKDWGGRGSYSEGNIDYVAGIPLFKSNHIPSTNIASATTGENNDYTGDFTDTVAIVGQKAAAGTLTLRDIATQITAKDGDFNIMYQSMMLLSKMAVGHGILNSACSIELSKAVA